MTVRPSPHWRKLCAKSDAPHDHSLLKAHHREAEFPHFNSSALGNRDTLLFAPPDKYDATFTYLRVVALRQTGEYPHVRWLNAPPVHNLLLSRLRASEQYYGNRVREQNGGWVNTAVGYASYPVADASNGHGKRFLPASIKWCWISDNIVLFPRRSDRISPI